MQHQSLESRAFTSQSHYPCAPPPTLLLLPQMLNTHEPLGFIHRNRLREGRKKLYLQLCSHMEPQSRVRGTPVAQLVKRWPTVLAVPSSSPARGEIFSTANKVSLHTAFHFHPLIWLEYCRKGRKIASHLCIPCAKGCVCGLYTALIFEDLINSSCTRDENS